MSTRRASAGGPLAAFVLHHHDWSETSLIVEFFTRERGRMVAAAKGAKRPYSQLRPVLMPFQRLNVQFGKAPADDSAEVYNLRSAEWAGGVPMTGGPALFAGFYLNELLLRLLARQDAHPLLFDMYADTLQAMSRADESGTQAALRAFELVLLRELGVLPELALVTQTVLPVRLEGHYGLDAEAGVVESPGSGLVGRMLVTLEAALEHGSGVALRQAVAGAVPPLRGPLRGLLHYHLGSSQLRTRRVMLDVQKLLDLEGTSR